MDDWDAIINDLHVRDDVPRYVAACETMDRVAERRHLPQLHELLANGRDFTIREAVAVPIARLEGVRSLHRLLLAARRGRLEGHDNDGLNQTIVEVVESDKAAAATVLDKMLAAEFEDDRADAAWLWGFLKVSAGPERLIALAEDRSARVRANVMGSLSSYKGRDDVLRVLLCGLGDEQAEVRVAAASSLGYYGDIRAIAALDALASDPDARVRRFASYSRNKLMGSPAAS